MAACNLSAIVSVTGDCTSSGVGAFLINILGTNPPYFYQSISPTFDPIATPLPIGVTSFGQNNLLPGTYSFLIFDSCPGSPTQVYANVIISDGVCASLVGHSNTTCNLPNGSISASTNNELTSTDYFLYENTAGYITSANSINDIYVFQNLSAGTYYVTVNDGGGCSARTESCIIRESTPLDFGFYVVDNTGCNPTPTGKVFVTGITGTSPYIYQWSTGALTSSITGLTQGVYQLTLTDATGCQTLKSAVVNLAPPITVVDYAPISPTCTGSDGEITITINGGTAPFNYVGSNGQSTITFDRTFSLTGLSSGIYTITVTDAGLCTQTFTYTLTAPNGFSILTVGIVNSTCNNSSGALSPISLVGGTPPFLYTLTYPSGNSIQQTVNGFSNQFQGLSAGTYTLTISNAACSVTNTYTINNTIKFGVNTSISGATCDTNNGAVSVSLTTGGTSPYTYYFTGQPTISNTSQTAITINNLFAGTYTLSVSDATNCTQTQTVVVPDTPSIDFTLVPTNASNINNGQIQTYITDGPAPYTISWSNNVNGQTGLTLTNLSAGTYTATIIDENGCELTRSVTIYGYNNYGTYGLYDYCESTIEYNGITIQKKIPQMYAEGYYDLVSGETNCILNSAIFYSEVSLAGVSAQTQFYTSTSLGDYPSDNQWFDAIRDALLSYPVIGNVIILPADNRITIQTNCSDQSLSLDNSQVTVALKISYDVSCVCNIPPIPGPVFNDCDMIYIQPTSEVYYYEYSSDTSTLLSVTNYGFNSPSVAFTNNKMWLYTVGATSTLIKEWNITTNPFTATYNRDINLNFAIGDAIVAYSDTKLITTNTNVTPNIFVEIDISTNTPIITNKYPLANNRRVIGSIVILSNNINAYSLQEDSTNAPFYTYHLGVHGVTTMQQFFEIDISTVGIPSGIFADNGSLYIVSNLNSIYEIDLTSPYSLTFISSVGGAGTIQSITQRKNCYVPQISGFYLNCNNEVSINGGFPSYINGYHIVKFYVGTQIGNYQFTVTGAFRQRVQITWNDTIVADSLFLLDTTVASTYNSVRSAIMSITQMESFYYNPPLGNGVNVFPTTDWTSNGLINVNFTTADFAPCCDLRLGGSWGNQIGVVPSYPTAASFSGDQDIQLQFTKTSQYPDYVYLIVYGTEVYSPQIQLTQCP